MTLAELKTWKPTKVSFDVIEEMVRIVVAVADPEKVILFGSYARGDATEDSDVDLLVIMDHDKPRNVDQAIAIQIKIAAPFPLDLLVKRPAEVAKRLNSKIIKDIIFT